MTFQYFLYSLHRQYGCCSVSVAVLRNDHKSVTDVTVMVVLVLMIPLIVKVAQET